MINYILAFFIGVLYVFIFLFCRKVFFKTLQKGYGTPSKRFFAFFIDVLIMYLALILWLLFNLIFKEEFRKEAGEYISGIVAQGETYYVQDFNALSLKLFVVYFLYSLVMQLLPTKATLSQRWLDLKVSTTGSYGFLSIIIRNLLKIPTIVLWPVTYVLSRTNDKGKWLHDVISQSEVLDVEQK